MRSMSRVWALVCALVISVSAVSVVAPISASANTFNVSWQLPPGQYGIGIDHVCAGNSSPPGYEKFYEYPTSVNQNNAILTNPFSIVSGCTLSVGRVEIYTNPGNGIYDPWGGGGAVALQLKGSTNVGMIPVPSPATAGKLRGNLLSRSAIGEGRVHLDIFQVTGQPTTSTGVPADAFSSNSSRGAVYQTGPLWNGQYIAFVTDTATGNHASGFIDVSGDTVFDLDLDMTCFGIDACAWTGSVGQAAGAFHPLPPTRLADTRVGLGIPHGALTPGDGRNGDPNYENRVVSYENHELRVAGVGGVPAVGVSAVLLNVTATGGETGGSLRVYPKPPNTDAFDHQSSFSEPPQINQVFWRTLEDSPNLVLAKVGVGGKVRIGNMSFGRVHVVVDVVGWYDQGQPGQSGAGLVATTPQRFLDTRNGIGGPKSPFTPNSTRALQVAGAGQIPSNAVSVVGTITGINPTSQTFITAWPAGQGLPNSSVLNVAPDAIRPNLVSIAPGSGGQWSLFNERGNHELLVDISGYYLNNSGGRITAVESIRMLDSLSGFRGRSLQHNETRALAVAGVGGVPADVSAVLLNVSVLDGTAWSYMTVFPAGQALPNASNLNWNAGDRRSNLVLVPVGPGGVVNLFNAFGQVHTIVDVVGWVK